MVIYGVNPVLESIRSHPERVRYVGVAREQTSRHQRLIAEAKKPIGQWLGMRDDDFGFVAT